MILLPPHTNNRAFAVIREAVPISDFRSDSYPDETQDFTAKFKVEQTLVGWTEYNPSTCQVVDTGAWTIITEPNYGPNRFGIENRTVSSGPCAGQTWPFNFSYYTWTDKDSMDPDDLFSLRWHTADGLFAETGDWLAKVADPEYIGDVPGRRLGIYIEGHVGLWTGSQVLEMDGKQMVYKTIDAFKEETDYYGAKARGKLNRRGILGAALAQKQYNPTYTIFAKYIIGGIAAGKKFNEATQKWENVGKTFPGVFRCDSLVNYAYKYGDGSYIRNMTEKSVRRWEAQGEYYNRTEGSGSEGLTPNLLYNTLPDKR
jgi:hypothetical protein